MKYEKKNPNELILRKNQVKKLDVRTENVSPQNYQTDDSSEDFSKNLSGIFISELVAS